MERESGYAVINTVIIHKGLSLPGYLADFVDQFYLFNKGNKLWLIVDEPFPEAKRLCVRHQGFNVLRASDLPITRNHRYFSRWNRMDAVFRGGFWRFAIERFFILEAFMASARCDSILHFEYDNMVYFDVTKLETAFLSSSNGISLPADSVRRCIPSVVFVKNHKAIEDFCRTYNLLYLIRKMNDMQAFSHYAKARKNACSFIPVLPSWYKDGRNALRSSSGITTKRMGFLDADYGLFQGVFDAAAFGQYLGGVDPRNTAANGPGFINETALYSAAEMPVRWAKDEAGLLYPVGSYKGRDFKIFNLHIHSKNLAAFRSDRIMEQK